MKKDDFEFLRVEGGEYCDHWFKITGDTKEELTRKYMEQSMIEVSEAVISLQDGKWGIKRVFPFNFDIITPEDEELRKLIESVLFEYRRKIKDKKIKD